MINSVTVQPTNDIVRAVLDTAREGMLIVNASMRITAANRAADSAFAPHGARIEGKRLSEVIRNLRLHETFRKALENGEASDIRFDFTSTGKQTFDVHVAPVDLDNARHAIGVFYDVGPIERLETVRQEFLSNISHELRTPLTSIIAFVETLEDGAIDDRENNRRFLSVIRRNAERMHALIDDILELSLIESGNVSIDTHPVRPFEIVENIFASLAAKAAERQITLVNDVPQDALVTADPIRLEQMLTNLIDNAIKFNRHGGSVTVSHAADSLTARILVSDTGEGLTAEQLQRIFERFYRADRGRTREVGGTGLGLAIVKHLARLHGGEVSVASTLNRGTVFTIELPEP